MVARSPNTSQSPFSGMPAHFADCVLKFDCKRFNCCLPPFQCSRLHFVFHKFMAGSKKIFMSKPLIWDRFETMTKTLPNLLFALLNYSARNVPT